eukprot:TRINITY_DN5058_c0_g1_i3.p2 TRINITY_DN5058_c0_g1~~TRINITY_DN5058_c0_g1_i3.p2  ORF type:complete len:148 (-),score=40.33 TRINITY_DN5058_c0_g1_i3:623-1066(-)
MCRLHELESEKRCSDSISSLRCLHRGLRDRLGSLSAAATLRERVGRSSVTSAAAASTPPRSDDADADTLGDGSVEDYVKSVRERLDSDEKVSDTSRRELQLVLALLLCAQRELPEAAAAAEAAAAHDSKPLHHFVMGCIAAERSMSR